MVGGVDIHAGVYSKGIVKALTIAGSDSGAGAGIQADLKTFQALDVYGLTAITAITAQNTTGVQSVCPVSTLMVQQQIHSVFADLRPDAVKTGMLYDTAMIEAVVDILQRYEPIQLVVDPVMIAKGGSSLLDLQALDALTKRLVPLATLVTPNLPEAQQLTGLTIRTIADRRQACEILYNNGASAVLIKGGHETESEQAMDLLYDGQHFTAYSSPRILTKNTHGTGCTLSAAITAYLAKGLSLQQAVYEAKCYIQAAIDQALPIGSGHGPLQHRLHSDQMMEKASSIDVKEVHYQ